MFVGGDEHTAPGAGDTDGARETGRETVCAGPSGPDVGTARLIRCHTPGQ